MLSRLSFVTVVALRGRRVPVFFSNCSLTRRRGAAEGFSPCPPCPPWFKLFPPTTQLDDPDGAPYLARASTIGRPTMCRNIKTLANFEPPATEDEIRASALQFVRK